LQEYFEGFAKIKSLGKFASVTLPIYKSSQYNKWKNRGSKLCLSIKIFKKNFQLTWDWERDPSPAGEKVVGLDQGLKTVVTLSDGQSTPNQCPHGHSLESVIDKLARKKKDSKGFKKAQTHRKNFTHWSINQLNFSGLKEVRLEKVVNIRKGRSCSRKMSHWSNPEIRDKIKRRCEELEVPVIEQSCAYRSQRCSACGIVRKANRKGKFYTCKGCKWECDADLNAALNHESDLPDIPFSLLGKKLNLGDGFLWKSDGIFRLDGSELIVPVDQKNNFQ